MNVNQDNTNSALYGYWMIRPGFWGMTNQWQNFQYLLIGESGAALIDTGYGEGNIRFIVEQITDTPVRVINTHGHYDHTGGNGCWPQAWMGEASTKDCRRTFLPEHDVWAAQKPFPNYEARGLADGDLIDLGGETIEVIAIPAHHDGSLALLARKNRVLFTGDEYESGQVLMLKERADADFAPTVAWHRRNAQRLLARRAEYDYLFPAHNGFMLDPDRYLRDFIELDGRILDGTAEEQNDTAGFNFPADPVASGSVFGTFGRQRRVRFGTASIIYLDNR